MAAVNDPPIACTACSTRFYADMHYQRNSLVNKRGIKSCNCDLNMLRS